MHLHNSVIRSAAPLLLCFGIPSTYSFVPRPASLSSPIVHAEISRTFHGVTPLSSSPVRLQSQSPPHRRQSTTSLSFSSSSSGGENSPLFPNTPSSWGYLAAWIFFVSYALVLSPSGSNTADLDMVMAIIADPIHPGVNELFYCIFDWFAVAPITLACLIMPSAKGQRVPATPFLIAASAIGYMSLGPYMTLRQPNLPTPKSEWGWFTKNVLENKILNYATLLLALATPFTSGLIPALLSTTPPESMLQGYLDLVSESRLAAASTLDLSILTVVSAILAGEDAERRGVENGRMVGWATLLLPVVGAAAYVALRPSVEEDC